MSNTTNAGRFRWPVTIEQLKEAPTPPAKLDVTDPDSWEEYISRRAEIVELTGREFNAGDANRSHLTHRVTLLFDSDTRNISPKMRVKWTDSYAGEEVIRYLHIENRLFSQGRRMVVQLQCQEVLP